MKKILYDYKHSKFIECNEQLAKENAKNETYKQKVSRNIRVTNDLYYITAYFESLHKEYWLAAGTLLGWYRDCGIIPFTTDADLIMRVEDYDKKIVEFFKGNRKMPLYSILGKVLSWVFRFLNVWKN